MANHFLGRTSSGSLYRCTTVNTSKLSNNPQETKEIQRDLLADDNLVCQLCLNKLAEANDLSTIDVLQAPDKVELLTGTSVPLLHTQELDINQYGELMQLWDANRKQLCVHFRANQEHQESSVGHHKRHVGRTVDVNETAAAIISENELVGRFNYTYRLVTTSHCKRPVILIEARTADNTLAKRLFVYEMALGIDYYLSVKSVIEASAKDDGVQDRVILSVAKVERGTYASQLRGDFKYHISEVQFVQRNFETDGDTKQVKYTALTPISVEDADVAEAIGGGASGEVHCSTAEADERQQALGIRTFASNAERLNYYSSFTRGQVNSSAQLTEFELMDVDELETIANHKHDWYGTETEVYAAASILETRRVNNDERLLSLAVRELRQFQFTDSTSIRQIGKDAPFLTKKAEAEMWAQPSGEYSRLGLDTYLTDGGDYTFAALAVAQGRIEDITELLKGTMQQLQSKKFAGLHYSIKLLGQHLCHLMAPVDTANAVAVDY